MLAQGSPTNSPAAATATRTTTDGRIIHMPPKPRGPNFKIAVPEPVGAGVYSNLTMVWHTPHEFTLDFAVIEPPQEQGIVPARVVSRARELGGLRSIAASRSPSA
jgi:hypothetical protein